MRILFLNDLGFQYGAGIGHARQIQSMLLGGHTVGAICGADGHIAESLLFTREGLRDGWCGLTTLGQLFRSTSHSDAELVDGLLMAAARFYPDVIVVGNLHGAGWPLEVLPEMARLGCHVVAYLHDLHLVTGRCVYPGGCKSYLTGCDASCPTPHEYPALAPDRIAGAWQRRRDVLDNAGPVTIATNSEYMRRTASAALRHANIRTIYLGADQELFRPGGRRAAQKALGLPDDRPIVLTGAVNLTDRRKGAHLLKDIVRRVGKRAHFVAFGHPSPELPSMRTLGYHTDPRQMAMVYRAADVFLGTASEEAFGQTLLEAGLSGIPCAAFDVGGVPEIIRANRTGFLAPAGDTRALSDAVVSLVEDQALRRRMGAAARTQCTSHFSLEQQLHNWAPLLDEGRRTTRRAA